MFLWRSHFHFPIYMIFSLGRSAADIGAPKLFIKATNIIANRRSKHKQVVRDHGAHAMPTYFAKGDVFEGRH